MKNVTISLSEDLVQILDRICKDCNLTRYAFTKEALIEKIERHTKNEPDKQDQEDPGKAAKDAPEKRVLPPFLRVTY